MSERQTDLNFCTVTIIRSGIDGKPRVRLAIGGDAMHLSAADAVSLAAALRDAAGKSDVEPAAIGWAAAWLGGERRTTEAR